MMIECKQETQLEFVIRTAPVAFPRKIRGRHALAAASGVPVSTVIKVVTGESQLPRADTVQKLYDAIKAKLAADADEAAAPKKRRVRKAKGESCTA